MSVVVSPASVIAPALELTLTAAALLLVVLKPVSAMFPGALIVIVPEPALIVVPAFIAIAPDRKSVVKGKSVDLGGRRIIKKKTAVKLTSSPPRSVMSPALLVT